MTGLQWQKKIASNLLGASLLAGAAFCAAADEPSNTAPTPNLASGLYLKVRLSAPAKISKLKPGETVQGVLSRDVYSADHKLLAAGSAVRLTVDHLEKRRRTPNDHWPWVIKVLTPRHENYPVFKTATVAQAEGETPLQVSLISVSRRREVHAKAKAQKDQSTPPSTDEHGAVEASKSNAKLALPTLVLEAFSAENSSPAGENKNAQASAEPTPEALPAGTQCKILLLDDVSASKSKAGDVVHARLLEPVILNSKLALPAGTLFLGKVVKRTPPRWLSRSGSLYLAFTELALPDGNHFPIAASLAAAELDQRSHTRIDSEGQLHGQGPGKAWMAINLGTSIGLSKVADDGIQLVIEAIVSTATDVSTAGTGRIVAGCVSGLYLVTRHGRDVVLPRFTEMDIALDRPVSLNPVPQVASSSVVGGGK